ncbi:MAG TPA: hypothetical protein PKD46_07655 [Aggregatilineaceae bacterium]|nr:hypothetical protein [Anaerolineae bacterium]HMM28142.1 hypothetical protein [Aggregatilineaceae bacterium]
MIITRTPVRIPLGGGGTDLPSYYSRRGGALISAAIDKYIYVTVNRRFERSIRLSYSQTEIVEHPSEIQHPVARAALGLLDLTEHLEITTIADIPSNTGLGTSSSFTVGLLNALHTYKRETLSTQALAEEAYHVEHDLLGEPVGKQDQYLAAFGYVTCLDITPDGCVCVSHVRLSDDAIDQLESNILLFYTGIRRSASEVLVDQNRAAEEGEEAVLQRLDTIKELGLDIRRAIEAEDLRQFGALLDQHWQTKKRLSGRISLPAIDRWYDIARANGALGGKLIGAGGGGFLLVYCDNHKRALRQAMAAEGLVEMRFRLDRDGSKVLVNL